MKKIGIITDTHSSITPEMAEKLGILVLPMPFYIGEECYYEGKNITKEEFFEKLDSGEKISTSQPSPESVTQIWDEALKEYESILYLPISSGLSGSCSTAMAMAQDEPYEGRVFVVDNGRVSALLHQSVLDALELIEEGYSAAEIKEILENARDKMVIYIAVDTLKHLKEGGRITPAVAAIGSLLNIKPILKFDVDILGEYKKSRGFQKAKKLMLGAMKEELETHFKEYYEKGEVTLMAASSASKEEAENWVEEIKEAFPGLPVLYDDLSMGLCCHIGKGGLGIGCSCRPKRPLK